MIIHARFEVHSYFTCCKSRAPTTSGMGRVNACIDRVQKLPFYAPLWRLTAQDRRVAQGPNLGSVKQKAQTANKPSQGSHACLEMVVSLKGTRNRVLYEVSHFLKFGYISFAELHVLLLFEGGYLSGVASI